MSGLTRHTSNGVEGVFSTHAAVDEAAGDVVLTVRGEVDFSTAQEFEGTLRNALSDTRRRLVVDLRALRFLDSTGLATLLRLDRRARATSREVIFVNGPAQIRRVFALTGVSELLTMVDEPPGEGGHAGSRVELNPHARDAPDLPRPRRARDSEGEA